VKDDPGAELFKQLEVPVLADGRPSSTEREGCGGIERDKIHLSFDGFLKGSGQLASGFKKVRSSSTASEWSGSLTAVVEKLFERVWQVHATSGAIGGRSESAGPAPLPTLGAAAFGTKTPPSIGLRHRANATCESRNESTADCPTGLAPMCAAQPPALSPPAPASPDATSR
jgi:hypothetical protein